MAENVNIVIKAFDKTKPAFNGVTKALSGITSAVFSMRSALVVLGGAAGFGYMVKASIDATDTLKKTADKIGTTTEALSALRYAAEISGVATNTLDMAMQRFTRRTAEAAKGTGEAKSALKELGIDARKLQRLSLDQQMLVLSDAFSGVGSEADKVRLAFKLFDSEGVALVNTLSLGSKGLEDLFGRAKALGIVMSGNAAGGVEKAKDALHDLFSIGKGLRDQFVAALAPAIQHVAERFINFFMVLNQTPDGIQLWAKDLAKGFIDSTISIAKSIKSILSGISNAYNFMQKKINDFRTFLAEDEIKGVTDQVNMLREAYIALGKDHALSLKMTAQLMFGGVGRDLESVTLAYEDAMNRLEIAKRNLTSITPADQINMGSIIDIPALEAEAAELKGIIDNVFSYVPKENTILEQTNLFKDAFEDWRLSIPDLNESLKSLANQGLNGLTDALTAGVTGAATFADAIKSLAKSVVDSLIKMLIQKYIVDAAFGFITAGFSQASTNLAGGYSAGMGDPFSDSFTPRAIGGSVQRGQPYMVGERGTEMFIPNQSGSIVPNDRLGGGGSVVVNQTINVSTGVQQTVRAEIATLMPQIANAAKSAVADARMRGGSYSKSLVGA